MMIINPHVYAVNGVTRLMMHFNGTDGSTTFTDSSAFNWTATGYATAQLSTSIKKFGSASFYMPVNHDYIQMPYQVGNFGIEDFCVECWVYPVTKAGNGGVIGWNLAYAGFRLEWDGSVIKVLIGNAAVNGWAHNVNGATTIPLSAWTHIAVTRQGQILKLFINGVVDVTINAATTLFPDTANNFNIGGFGNHFGVGYIDEFRVIKGAAIYTSNFTPPTAEF